MSSKNFETQLYIKNYKSDIIKGLIDLGVSDLDVKVIDSWQYENETPIESADEIEEKINNDKIVIIEGEYKKINCGCFISKITSNCYEFDIWISTKINDDLDDECVSNKNSYIYDMVLHMLKKLVAPRELILCVSGIEMSVEYSNDLNEILDTSSGVLQVICLPDTTISNYLSSNVRQDGDYMIIRP